jgi:hypothetical protein
VSYEFEQNSKLLIGGRQSEKTRDYVNKTVPGETQSCRKALLEQREMAGLYKKLWIKAQ